MRKETEDLVGELINSIDFNVTIKTIVDNGNGTYTLTTCNTLHLQAGFSLVIGVVTYKIVSVIVNESFILSGSVVPTLEVFEIYKPFYKFGTIITTNNELNKKNDANDILPLIYLRTEFEETFNNRNELIDRESPLEIFFLTQNKFSNEEVDIRNDGVLPMRNLVYSFIEMLNNSTEKVGKVEDYSIKNWLRFGFETSNGSTKNIFSFCDMSGCQLNVTLPIKSSFACCN